ncbi:Uncharacterised protein [Bordetella pertussis]|nr:Uncharacterised protein [Bordetella pertussis]
MLQAFANVMEYYSITMQRRRSLADRLRRRRAPCPAMPSTVFPEVP